MSLRELKELKLVNIVDNRLCDHLGKQLSSSPLMLAESSEVPYISCPTSVAQMSSGESDGLSVEGLQATSSW